MSSHPVDLIFLFGLSSSHSLINPMLLRFCSLFPLYLTLFSLRTSLSPCLLLSISFHFFISFTSFLHSILFNYSFHSISLLHSIPFHSFIPFHFIHSFHSFIPFHFTPSIHSISLL